MHETLQTLLKSGGPDAFINIKVQDGVQETITETVALSTKYAPTPGPPVCAVSYPDMVLSRRTLE